MAFVVCNVYFIEKNKNNQKINEKSFQNKILEYKGGQELNLRSHHHEPASIPLSYGPLLFVLHQIPLKVGSKMASLGVYFHPRPRRG